MTSLRKRIGPIAAVVAALVLMKGGTALGTNIDPAAVRAAAQAAGLRPLNQVPIPAGATNLSAFLNSGTTARNAALQLGKALFWDMQVGSDGQACGSCHFHAGADSRIRNQLDPGLRSTVGLDQNPPLEPSFTLTATGGRPPDYTMKTNDFPFHQLADPEEKNFTNRVVLFDTDDIMSSMGAFSADFTQVEFPLLDAGIPLLDPIFNIDTPNETSIANNVRRVEPRNTPTMINAVFNFNNFWDGRAHRDFNGQSVIGPLDTGAFIWVNNGAAGAAPAKQFNNRIPDSSLASQAVGPPTSDLEMSFFKRSFPLVGFKMLHAWQTNGQPLTPLGSQVVSPADSLLGGLSRSPNPGLNATYADLIRTAFQAKYWNGADVALQVPSGNSYMFTHMEANFTLFFGLAVQLYETTLVSDETPLDHFLSGRDRALTQEQLHGLLVFINQGTNNPPEVDAAIAQAESALGVTIGLGNCAACHSGSEFTRASFTSLNPEPGSFDLIEENVQLRMQGGLPVFTTIPTLLDEGWANIGVRPIAEDLGRGALADASSPDLPRFPLSFTRQFLDPNFNFLLPVGTESPCTRGVDCPTITQVDGAFKIPDLRNVELTGPFFHNGGQRTLEEVVQFYDRRGDFTDLNITNVESEFGAIDIDEVDEDPLVDFLTSLTDERVRQERAPFDHPQLFVPNGGTFDNAARPEDFFEVPLVGARGRVFLNIPPVSAFMEDPPVGVTFFEDINFNGDISQILGPGDYTLADLEAKQIVNDTASAVKIPIGWAVTIFRDDNFQGTQFTLTSDQANFTQIAGLNDVMSSARITAGPDFADFTLTASPSSVDLDRGSSATTTIVINKLNGFQDTVTLSISGLPTGVTATFSPTNATSSSTLTLRAASNAPGGTFFVLVTGVDGILRRTVAVNIQIPGAPDFEPSVSPGSVTIARSTSGSATVTILKNNGFNSAVTLSASNLPAGVTASFNPTTTSNTSTLTLTASSTATVGTNAVLIAGTSGALQRFTTLRLAVNLPVFQAEDAVVAGGAVVENNNAGFHGTGYVNFPLSGGTLTFNNIPGDSSVSVFLRFRYALGSGTRTGTLTVNGVSQSITFNATGSFTTWADKDVLVTLNSGTGNTIRLASTGQDLANIDELTIIAAPLPAPWQTRDIGAVGATGAASFANGTFTVLGDGADIFGTADAFRYVHQNSSGDCSITVRVASLQNTHPFAKAGAMIRESLSASSIEAAIVMTPTNGIRFQVRSTTGGTTANFGSVTGVTAPRFLRLTRSGNTFTAAQSSDGVNFTTVGTPQSISMLSSATLGMAVSSHTNGVLATATFSNVSATP